MGAQEGEANRRRTYNLRKRARASEETRLRILEAARALLSSAGYPNVTLDQIAAKAAISRQTVYVQFGSKRGVLQALAEHIELESYGRDMLEGVRDLHNPVGTIRDGIYDQIAFFERNADLLRNFYAQAAHDPDFRAVWQDRLQRRWDAIHIVVQKIAEQGGLAEGWGLEEATDWLWSITNFRWYDEMVIERGWSPQHLAQRLRSTIEVLLPSR